MIGMRIALTGALVYLLCVFFDKDRDKKTTKAPIYISWPGSIGFVAIWIGLLIHIWTVL